MATLAATTVKLIDAPPARYEHSTLRHWAGMPPTNDERLLATDDALVYQTDYRLLAFFQRAIQTGARLWAPRAARTIIDYLSSYVDTRDRALFLPWNMIRATGEVVEVQLGRRVIPFCHFEVRTPAGPLFFLQVPVAYRGASRDFQRLVGILWDRTGGGR